MKEVLLIECVLLKVVPRWIWGLFLGLEAEHWISESKSLEVDFLSQPMIYSSESY